MPENPFVLRPYGGKELFCDREAEMKSMLSAITGGANVTLIAPRRLGKTGLIFRSFDELRVVAPDIATCYVDIFATESLADFIEALAKALMRSFPEKTGAGKKLFAFIRSLRPVIGFNPVSGEPSISISYQTAEEKRATLEGIFSFIAGRKERMVIAIDEFQQVLHYPEKGTEALLRTQIQQCANASFIFCGSQRHMMSDMFMNSQRPFFASTMMMSLDKVAEASYAPFIKELFARGGQRILDGAVKFILEWTRTHTYYTQSLCNVLYEKHLTGVSEDDARAAAAEILQMNGGSYLQFRTVLTSAQWKYLKAVAHEGIVTEPMGRRFLSRYGIGTASSSKRLLEALIEKEFILDVATGKGLEYSVYDVFFSRFLEGV